MNMRFFTFLSAIFVLLASPVLGTSARFEEYKGQVKTNSYIIKLKSNVTKEDCLDWLTPYLESNALTHTGWEREVFHGFAGKVADEEITFVANAVEISGQFSDDVLTLLRSSPNIESVSEDGIMSINSAVTQ